VIAEKHGGATESKTWRVLHAVQPAQGSDLSTLDPLTGELRLCSIPAGAVAEHFELHGGEITARTSTGRVTVNCCV